LLAPSCACRGAYLTRRFTVECEAADAVAAKLAIHAIHARWTEIAETP
jgi:hypothetical protein